MQREATWGVGIFEGIVVTFFGIAAVFWPAETLITFLYIFATFVVAAGILNILGGVFSIGKHSMWFLHLILGVLELGVGIYLLRHPHVSFTALILLVGFTLIFRGLVGLIVAFSEPLPATARALFVIVGILAMLAGIVLLFQPVSGGVAFVWLLGLYALVAGPIAIAMSIENHNQLNHPQAKPARGRG